MFDIGFAELLLIGVVALLVIGPERLPETVRTASLWINRFRRGFNDIKREIQTELHNDAVMKELRDTGNQLKNEAETIGRDIQSTSVSLTGQSEPDNTTETESQDTAPEKTRE